MFAYPCLFRWTPYNLFSPFLLYDLLYQILFWDWRNDKQVACLEDSHVEDVTQVGSNA